MRLAATLTVGGIIGFILLEALKILLAPIKLWLMGVLALAVKLLLAGLGVLTAVGVGFFFLRRARKAQTEA